MWPLHFDAGAPPETSRQGIDPTPPAATPATDPDKVSDNPDVAAGNGETRETMLTIDASENGAGAETKHATSTSVSIMELFDTKCGAGTAADDAAEAPAVAPPEDVASATRGSAAVATATATAAAGSPLPPPPRPQPHALKNMSSFACQSCKTAPPSTGTGASGGYGRVSLGSSTGGAERHGFLSFSEVQVDDDIEAGLDRGLKNSARFSNGGGGNDDDAGSSQSGKEVIPRRQRKRARAWKLFLAVMQDYGLRVRKHHRHAKGWAYRVVKYDPTLPGLRWKSSKWWDSTGGQIPVRDVLDVDRRGKVVWIKCLHLGTIGFEASLETDAVIFYLAMDSLLDARCGASVGAREASRLFHTA